MIGSQLRWLVLTKHCATTIPGDLQTIYWHAMIVTRYLIEPARKEHVAALLMVAPSNKAKQYP